MLGVDFEPLIIHTGFFKSRVNTDAAVQWNVGILPPPDVKQFAADIACPRERIIVHTLAETAFMNIRRIKACRRKNIRIHGGAKRKMAPDTAVSYTHLRAH